jgi:hypothetical protein
MLDAECAYCGNLTAPDRETALARAYDEFNVTTQAERKRIIVLAANSPTWT